MRADPLTPKTMSSYSIGSHAEFAATVAGIRASLYNLADCANSRDERTVLVKAAAVLALFESDLLVKSARPILPGEQY